MTRFRGATIRDDLREPLAVFAGLVLAALVAVAAIVAIEALDGGGSGGVIVSNVTRTPAPTETVSPEGTPTPIQSAAPSRAALHRAAFYRAALFRDAPANCRSGACPQTAAPAPVVASTGPGARFRWRTGRTS